MTAFKTSSWIEEFKALDNTVTSYIDFDTEEQPTPFFVDIGGGPGHQCTDVRYKHPPLTHIPNGIILQDLPQAVQGLDIEGVKAMMSHGFFTKQPVSGKPSPTRNAY